MRSHGPSDAYGARASKSYYSARKEIQGTTCSTSLVYLLQQVFFEGFRLCAAPCSNFLMAVLFSLSQ